MSPLTAATAGVLAASLAWLAWGAVRDLRDARRYLAAELEQLAEQWNRSKGA